MRTNNVTHWIHNKNCTGYFGDAHDNLCDDTAKYALKKFFALQKKLSKTNNLVNALFFLKQTHSTNVFVLDHAPDNQITLFQQEGDAIITREKSIGIGVVTADCLPLFLVDSHHEAIGVIHAGWRGLSKKIITATMNKMQNTFNTTASDLQVYCGPSALVCCYEVQPDFLHYFSDDALEKNIIEKRDDKLFFNTRKAAVCELLDNQVLSNRIDVTHNICTICTPNFCSVRKQQEKAGRQPSVIYL